MAKVTSVKAASSKASGKAAKPEEEKYTPAPRVRDEWDIVKRRNEEEPLYYDMGRNRLQLVRVNSGSVIDKDALQIDLGIDPKRAFIQFEHLEDLGPELEEIFRAIHKVDHPKVATYVIPVRNGTPEIQLLEVWFEAGMHPKINDEATAPIDSAKIAAAGVLIRLPKTVTAKKKK